MTKAIYFDMDGTIANLYGVDGWLDDLINKSPRPYAEAKPLVNMSLLARLLHKAQKQGYTVNVVSWLAKNSTKEYDEKVTEVKKEWLAKHLPSVKFDEVHIIEYGTPKSTVAKGGILFDDEEQNRTEWKGFAYTEKEIFEVLKSVA